jgi:protocatechuate 3,4-dioxygenase beta subunit
VYTADGAVLETAYVSFDGTYTASDLPPGTYRVTAEEPAFIDELYDDVTCPGGPPVGCDLAAGTPVGVAAGATTPGIDFALTRLGSFSGAVTRASTGDPAGASIQVFDTGGALIRDVSTPSFSGIYTVLGLEAGTYFAVARSGLLADQLYQGLPCEPACDPTTGTPIPVALGVDTGGVDFALGEAGSITGTVTDAVTGEPVTEVEIYLWRANGSLRDWALVAGDGTYSFAGLETGTYFATSESWSGIYLDELYDSLPCSDGYFGCDVTEGTPIPVTLGAVTSGIDFTLDRPGAVSGRVTDASTGASLPGIEVEIWDAVGNLVREATTDVAGRYLADGLPLGSLFVTTRNSQGYLDELWSDLPCWHGVPTGCNPTKGTPVPVSAGQTTDSIDFGLVLFESGIVGTVRDGTTGEPLANTPVDIWSSWGYHRASVLTRESGAYQVGLSPGTYYVSTDNGLGLVDQVFDGVLCPLGPAFGGLCDPLAGTPVEVGAADSADPPVATGIDFALGMTLFRDGFESGDLSAWSEVTP